MKAANPLDDSVQFLKGVGPQKARLLSRLGISSVRDLLCFYPREYDDRRAITKISFFTPNAHITISGKIAASDVLRLNRSLSALKVAVDDGTGTAFAMFFRKVNPYHSHDAMSGLRGKMQKGAMAVFNGRSSVNFGEKQLNVEEFEIIESGKSASTLVNFNRIVPVYPMTQGLTSKWLRSIILPSVERYSHQFKEILPPGHPAATGLMPAAEALRSIHFPESLEAAEKARKRLALEEFLLLESALTLARKRGAEKTKERPYVVRRRLLTPFREKLGFEFTRGQKRTINEIFSDMENPRPMNRLLMGDVGSGKTVVALSAMLLAIENGYQCVFLAPTEILAEQHFITINHFLEGLGVRTELLTGKLSAKAKGKKALLERTASGETDLVIGTHAALESGVRFKNLALAVIDEQHRFGVLQRRKIQLKAENPDILLMTATPIPRTLSLTVYGDMDISVIDELPPGRQPIATSHMADPEAYSLAKHEIKKGRQAYIVYPLVEESDKLELKAAVQEAEALSKTVFSGFRVGLIHGQMPAERKDAIMRDFRQNKFDLLIATTVIEVGIDVPNATVMLIEHSERFGLATLHQLRGRVGRGPNKSYCVLLGKPKTDEARARIEVMETHSSGFKVAEADLEMRGPGEFLGTAQHGSIEFRAGNLVRDRDLIEKARDIAGAIISSDPELDAPANAELKARIMTAYSEKLQLLDIG